MARDQALTPKRFWDRLEQAARVAELHGSRFEGDTPAKRLRRMAEAVVLQERFNRHYLPHYFRDEGCGLHTLIYLALEQARFSAIRAPRGHGKTTAGTFAVALRAVACGEILRRLELGTLEAEAPELHREIQAVMAEEVARRLAAGALTCRQLGLPEHWDPSVELEMDQWLGEVHQRLVADQTIPLYWDPYIQIVAVDGDTATEFTAAIRAELERNPLLRGDWGDLTPCHHMDWGRKHKRPASDADFVSNDVRVIARGMSQSLRGGKHRQWRPTLMLGDDLDSEESVRTDLQRDRNIRKLVRAGISGLDERKRRVCIVGTPVDSDCIVCRLTEHDQYVLRRADDGTTRGRWVPLRTRARDEDGRILYPAKWTSEALDDQAFEDEEGYGSELDDRPPRDGDSPFDELHYYSRAEWDAVPLASVLIFDPSLGKSKTSDLQALAMVRGPTPKGEFLVSFTDGYRIADYVELCRHVNQVRAELDPDEAAVETIGFQALVEVMLAAEGHRAGVLDNWAKVESHSEGKDLRIRGLARLSNNRKLLWPDDESCRKGERQAKSYPRGKKDILDCIEMGVRRLRRGAGPRSAKAVRHAPSRRASFGRGAW